MLRIAMQAGNSQPLPNSWIGQKRDIESNLYFLNARYYSPTMGRFVQADSVVDPVTRGNKYSYVGENPVGRSDPNGTCGYVGFSLPCNTDPSAYSQAGNTLFQWLGEQFTSGIFSHGLLAQGMKAQYWQEEMMAQGVDFDHAGPNGEFLSNPYLEQGAISSAMAMTGGLGGKSVANTISRDLSGAESTIFTNEIPPANNPIAGMARAKRTDPMTIRDIAYSREKGQMGMVNQGSVAIPNAETGSYNIVTGNAGHNQLLRKGLNNPDYQYPVGATEYHEAAFDQIDFGGSTYTFLAIRGPAHNNLQAGPDLINRWLEVLNPHYYRVNAQLEDPWLLNPLLH